MLKHPKYLKTNWTLICKQNSTTGTRCRWPQKRNRNNSLCALQYNTLQPQAKHYLRKHMRKLATQKSKSLQTQLTVGGNLINFPGDVRTPTANMSTAKILTNRTISTKEAKFITFYLKKISYIHWWCVRFEWMKIPINLLPQEIINKYNPECFPTMVLSNAKF